MKTLVLTLALALPAGALWAQEEPFEEALTPEESLKMLQEIYALMGEAETTLNDAARAEGLATEKDVADKIAELIEQMDQSAATQRAVIDKMNRLLERSKIKQQTSVDRINELIRRSQR